MVLGVDRFLGGEKSGKGNGDRLVASPFGLRSGLRQSGDRFAVGFDAGLKPRSISEATATATATATARTRARARARADPCGMTNKRAGKGKSRSFDSVVDDETVGNFAQDDISLVWDDTRWFGMTDRKSVV